MSEPIRYLTEETYRPSWLKDGVTKSTLEAVIGLKPELKKLAEELAFGERFYLVGSGGSYSIQFPIRYIAEKYTKVPVYQYSGWEYLERQPSAVDEDAVCIFISQSGKTKEIIQGLVWTKTTGAKTLGIAHKPDSLLCTSADLGFGYTGRGVTMGKLTTLYLLFGYIFKLKGYPIGDEMIALVDSLPGLLLPMIPKAKENAKETGLLLKDREELYVLGGGINWGFAYQFAICTLQEMCWVHATPINYSEWRHGPLEMFTPGSAALFFKSRGGEDELEDNIINWSRDNGVECVVYDSQGLDVHNLLTPFTLFVELEWLSYYLSLAKNRDMEQWRYYDKMPF